MKKSNIKQQILEELKKFRHYRDEEDNIVHVACSDDKGWKKIEAFLSQAIDRIQAEATKSIEKDVRENIARKILRDMGVVFVEWDESRVTPTPGEGRKEV